MTLFLKASILVHSLGILVNVTVTTVSLALGNTGAAVVFGILSIFSVVALMSSLRMRKRPPTGAQMD